VPEKTHLVKTGGFSSLLLMRLIKNQQQGFRRETPATGLGFAASLGIMGLGAR
jgi:hypothetical protein